MNVRKILDYALEREREGYRFFSEHAAKARHAAVAGVFSTLAREEQGHIGYVERLIAGLSGEGVSATGDALDAPDGSFFGAREASEMLAQTTAEAMVPDLPALRMAFLIERDLAEFYAAQAAATDGPARAAFEQLAGWEREHERLFQAIHDRVFAEYAGMPWGG